MSQTQIARRMTEGLTSTAPTQSRIGYGPPLRPNALFPELVLGMLMLGRMFAATTLLIVGMVGSATASDKDAIAGVWKGTYQCVGDTASFH